MSETLIASLQSQVERLTKENAEIRSEAKGRRKKAADLAEQVKGLATERDDLLKDRDGWKQKAEAAPGEKDKQLAELQTKLRDRDHRDAYHKAAKAAGVPDDKLADFHALSGYKPEGDAIDEAAIAAHVGEALKGRPYFAGTATTTASDGAKNGDPTPAQLPPGPGAQRGARSTVANGRIYTRAELQDPEFSMRHAAEIAQAQKEGRVKWS